MQKITSIPTVSFDETNCELVIIDQTKLPNEMVLLHIHELEDTMEAIKNLSVRGAPAIGVSAAIGLYVASERFGDKDTKEFLVKLYKASKYLASSRPTAVNLFWALDRMNRVASENRALSVKELKKLLRMEALRILEEDIDVCRKLGEYGLTLIEDGDGILTHCNAGQLAAVKYGTALAPIHLGAERGLKFKVYCDETRPLLQGARLSAYEMLSAGMETTVLCDNMAASVLKNGLVKAVFTGCDRVAANGDTANKIGTLNVAILAKHYNIPFYIFAPTSTIDLNCSTGIDIVIENRNPEEVSSYWYKKPVTPEGVQIFNPAFDVTEASLITAIVTEFGVLKPPYSMTIQEIFKQKQDM